MRIGKWYRGSSAQRTSTQLRLQCRERAIRLLSLSEGQEAS
jgi:hypothetical protein